MPANDAGNTPFRFAANWRNQQEQDYAARLERVIAESPFSMVERLINFPMYTPRQDLTNFLIKYELFKKVLDVHGSIVECGCLFGGGLMAFAQLSAIFEPVNHTRKIIGFDTFEGFAGVSEEDSASTSAEAREGGLAIDSFEEIERCVELYDMNRSVGHIEKVELVRGDATETIPAYISDNPHLLVSLLYLDFDVYEPTVAALEHFVPRMPKGAIIGFDELNLSDWPGETVALLERFDLNGLRIQRFPFGSTISYVVLD